MLSVIERLRASRAGMRVLSVFGMIFHIPMYLWVTRDETAFAYRVYWQGLKTGGDV